MHQQSTYILRFVLLLYFVFPFFDCRLLVCDDDVDEVEDDDDNGTDDGWEW